MMSAHPKKRDRETCNLIKSFGNVPVPMRDIDTTTTMASNESNLQDNHPSVLRPLKRKRDDGIQSPEIYNIFINQFIDILADSSQEETVRHYHSLFHANKATQTAFLKSSSLAAKREQFEFEKCLEGLVAYCHLTVRCSETGQTYVFRFEPSPGIILHFRSCYCKMISPEDVSPVFNDMMSSSFTPKDRPLCSLRDFRRIWRTVTRKVTQWPNEFLLHERHMGNRYSVYHNKESDEMYTRMGYTHLEDPTPVGTSHARQFGEVLTRIENWRKREEQRSLTRMEEIGKQRNMETGRSEDKTLKASPSKHEIIGLEMGGELGEIVAARSEVSEQRSKPVMSKQQPEKPRRSLRLSART